VSDWLTLLALALIALIVIGLGWWLLIESEGVYLGRRVVIWLYDLYAGRYDDIKHFRQDYDHLFLAQPIMERIAPNRAPLVLDVATGTARLPLALLRHKHFAGRIFAADLSKGMLHQAALKLERYEREYRESAPVMLLCADAERLPFGDSAFDVVTCLEALEFTPHPAESLRECVRVLRPGGLLLITNRLTGRWMPGKTWTQPDLTLLLMSMGIDQVTFEPWQVDYIRVWGVKGA
jgi:ubiquinone/menaquinone biosynthesis C-methylase UbiE